MKHRVLVSLLSLTLLSGGALAGCKKNTAASSSSESTVTSSFDKFNPVSTANKDGKTITLSQTALTLAVGKTSVLATTLSDGLSGAITWGSSDDAVATVAANGKVTAVAGGVCKISAYLNGASAVCDVTVISGTIAFNGESTLEVGAELLIQPTVTSGLKDHTMNFAFPADKAAEYGAIVTLPTKVAGVVGITIKGKAEGTAKIHACMAADENVGIDITITVIAAKPTVSEFFDGFTAKNYTIESKLVSEDDFDDDSFDVKTADSAKFKTASGETAYVYNAKRTEKAITSQLNGADIWKKAGIAVDKNGNAGYLLRDATSGAITADPAGRIVTDNGFPGADDFDGDKKTFSSSPIFEGINAMNPDWASGIEKADDNTYEISFDGTDADYLDFETVFTLWNIFDPVGSTSVSGDGVTLGTIAQSVKITLKIVDNKDIIVKLSSDAFTLGTESTKYRVMSYIKDIGTTAQAADFAAAAGNADLEFALPTLNSEIAYVKGVYDGFGSYIDYQNNYVKYTKASGGNGYAYYNNIITPDYMYFGAYDDTFRADYLKGAGTAFPATKYGTVYYVNSTDNKVHSASVDNSSAAYSIVAGTDAVYTVKDSSGNVVNDASGNPVQATWNDGGKYDVYQGSHIGNSCFNTDDNGVAWYLLSDEAETQGFQGYTTKYHHTSATAALDSATKDLVDMASMKDLADYCIDNNVGGIATVVTKADYSGGWFGMSIDTTKDATTAAITSADIVLALTPTWGNYAFPDGLASAEYHSLGTAKDAALETALGTTYVKHAA